MTGRRRRRTPEETGQTRQPDPERSPAPTDPGADEAAAQSVEFHAQQLEVATYSGPLPDPVTLAEYEELVPGVAQQLFNQLAEQEKHRRGIELAELAAARRTGIVGQWMAFLLGAGGLSVALVLALNGNGGWATGAALGPITILAGMFLTGQQKKERG